MATQQISVIPTSFPVRDLQRRYSDILKFVKINQAPALLLNNSRAEAVILDIGTYNALVADDYQYDEKYILELDKKAQTEHKSGKTKKLKSLADLK